MFAGPDENSTSYLALAKTREAYRNDHQNHHATLGMFQLPFQKYLQNYVLETSADIDFDVIMKSYFGDGTGIGAIRSGGLRHYGCR